MFNLNQAITEWRRQMTAGGIKTPAVLDELESHLREDVEQHVRSGIDAQRAFDAAVKKIGPASALRIEFKKSTAGVVLEKLMIVVAFLFVAFGIFLSVVTIIFCYLTIGERLIAFTALGVTLSVALGWSAFVPRLPVIHEKRKRQAIEIACLLVGFGVATLFAQTTVHHFEAGLDRILPPIFFWCLLPIAVGFGLASGLEEAARGRTEQLRA
jgi:hypothetical protein